MSKNISLLIVIALAVAGFWWLGQKTQNNIVPLSSLDINQIKDAVESKVVELEDGDSYDMVVDYVKKSINGKNEIMLAYNGSIPGPVIKVPQHAEITLNLVNNTSEPTLLHAHGLRMDNAFDGTHLTQDHIEPGETFSYTLSFPDPGMYWYHPHLREDKNQALGLAGNFWVVPDDEEYWSPVNREVPLILSDILTSDNGIVSFGESADHTLMGRFGNVMLVNGREDYELTVKKGEVVRLYITNAATARPFNVAIPGASMKLVGADSGAFEEEAAVDRIIISPAERYIVEAYFEKEGEFAIIHDGPEKKYTLGTIVVTSESVEENYVSNFKELRINQNIKEEVAELRGYMDEPAHKRLTLSVDMAGMGHGAHQHGMPCHQMPDGSFMGDCDEEGSSEAPGIEWEDDMPTMNRMSNTENVSWQLIDEDSGKVNNDINWRFKQGDKVKISIFNDDKSAHPMQHPIHFHGQRFLILKENDEENDNLAWKDTVLVPAGQTVEILLDVTNPGIWMVHCHMAEHLEAGMAFAFEVD